MQCERSLKACLCVHVFAHVNALLFAFSCSDLYVPWIPYSRSPFTSEMKAQNRSRLHARIRNLLTNQQAFAHEQASFRYANILHSEHSKAGFLLGEWHCLFLTVCLFVYLSTYFHSILA